MVYTTRRRNRFRLTVSAVTGVLTAGAMTATGWLAGQQAAEAADAAEERAAADLAARAAQEQAAADYARRQQEYAAALAAAEPRRVVIKPRPRLTRTTVRYVRAAPSGYAGSGGGVSSSGPSGGGSTSGGGSGSSGGGGGGGGGTSAPMPMPPPPPPPPPPVPSSGS